MIGATLCSGIGAPEVAAPWVDWRLASETDPFARAVLAERFGYAAPEDHDRGEPLLWGDMRSVTPDLWREHGIPLPDIVVAGTPCQSFSVAGLRKGLEDDRGNLTLKFVELCHDIVTTRPDGQLIVLWENVPGVLSDRTNAFGAFLGGLVGADAALPAPGDGRWPGAGMVAGPRARAAWRVLDAQYFGLAQRRKRVFAVVDLGGRTDPARVLFEPKGLRGHSAPRREAGEDLAGTLAARARGGGGPGTDFECDGGLHAGGRLDFASEALIAFDCKAGGETGLAAGGVMTALRGDGHGGGHAAVASRCAVRRLTPAECARLQGFEDDHCAITWRGKPAADGPQYKALGNSMAVPVVRWIMDRIRAEAEASGEGAA